MGVLSFFTARTVMALHRGVSVKWLVNLTDPVSVLLLGPQAVQDVRQRPREREARSSHALRHVSISPFVRA